MKYKLRLDLTKQFLGKTLFRIEAMVSIKSVGIKAGDLGGYIEKEGNLDIYGNAWVSGNAQVYGNAWVSGNARVSGDARVSGNAQVSGDARVSGDAWVRMKMDFKKNHDLVHILNFKYGITVSLTGITVGCKDYKDLKVFLAKVDKDGKENNYTPLDLKYLKVSVKNAIKYLKNKAKE